MPVRRARTSTGRARWRAIRPSGDTSSSGRSPAPRRRTDRPSGAALSDQRREADPTMTERSSLKQQLTRPLLIGAVTGLAYVVVLRGAAEFHWSWLTSVMTVSFLFVSPIVLGFLTVRPHPSPSWPYRIFAPWLPSALSLVCFLLVGWEGAICIAMALPIMLPL